MTKFMLIDALHPEETRLVITEDGMIEEFDFVTQTKTQIKSNLYLAKITRVEPSLQAAFVEYGGDKQGFLPFAEIHPDYYQIPMADRARIIEEELRAEAEAQARAAAEDEEDSLDEGDEPAFADEANGSEDDDQRGRGRRGRGRRGRRRLRGDRERSPRDASATEEGAEGSSDISNETSEASAAHTVAQHAPSDDSSEVHASVSEHLSSIRHAIQHIAQVRLEEDTRSEVSTDTPSDATTDSDNTAASSEGNADDVRAIIADDTAEYTAEVAPIAEEPKRPRRGRPSKPRPAEMSSDALTTSSDIVDEEDGDAADNLRASHDDTHESSNHLDHQDNDAQDDEQDAEQALDGQDADASESERANSRRRRRRGRNKNRNARRDESSDEASTDSEDDAEEGSEEDEIETVSGDESDENYNANHLSFRRRYKIQEVVKRGQIVLVQVIKEERGNKGVSLTTYISLPGRYCVLMPNSPKGGGISRKIARSEDRKRLRAIAAELRESSGLSAIIRTAGIDRTKEEIQRDYEYLVKLWNQVRETALSSSAPALVYEEGDIIKRSIRDYYNADIDNVIVQGEEAFQNARDFMKLIMPSHASRVKQYREEMPIFSAYDVEPQLQAMHKPTSRLKSGGYIVIDPTEALISIDVNSGRSTTERNVEETALKTNLEAAAQIARQLRLRDLGGLVVIDFIDMYHSKHRRMVERALKDALKKDRAKIQVGHISPFGLLELSRQRLRPSISEATSSACPHCSGSGRIRSRESLGIEIIRELEKEASTGQYAELTVTVTMDQALHLLNFSRDYLSKIEQNHHIKLSVRTDNNMATGTYALEKVKLTPQARQERDKERERERDQNRQQRPRHHNQQQHPRQQQQPSQHADTHAAESMDALLQEEELVNTEVSSDDQDAQQASRGSRRRRGARGGRRRRFERDESPTSQDNAEQQDASSHDDAYDNDGDNNDDGSFDSSPRQDNWEKRAYADAPVATAMDSTYIASAPEPIAVAPVIASLPTVPTVPVIEEPAPAVIIDEAPKANKSTRSGWWRRIVDS
jgi:ribonuclease E